MWHYEENGESKGPVEKAALESMLRSGRLAPDARVWSEGMPAWAPASAHFDTAAIADYAPPPLPKGAAPARSFGEAIKVCFSKYVTFKGRASRSEFWYFVLFQALLSAATALLPAINVIVSVGLLLPSFAVTFRRLHDTDRSGWWIGGFYLGLLGGGIVAGLGATLGGSGAFFGLLGFAVIGYMIALLVFTCQPGTQGPNRFDAE